MKDKHQTKRRISKSVHTIRELRIAFEHMEDYAKEMSKSNLSEKAKISNMKKEWKKVFYKQLSTESAKQLLIEHESRRTRGGALSGAPIEHTTHPGLYLSPGQRPDADGGLPLSGQSGGAYGSYHAYIDSGFSNPAMAQSYDPVQGQPAWPSPSPSMGTNVIQGGRRQKRTRRRIRGGTYVGAILDQAFSRPIPSGAPPSVMQDMQDMWHGGKVGSSPDQIQRHPVYQLNE